MLKVTVKNAGVVSRRLNLYGGKLNTWKSLWKSMVSAIAAAETEWFATEGEGSWKQLSAAYAAQKAMVFPGQPILVATGDLRDSLTTPTRLAQSIGPDSLSVGSDVSYAAYHQSGTQFMPARPPLIPVTKMRAVTRLALEAHVAYRTPG